MRRGNLACQQQFLAEAFERIRAAGQFRPQQLEGDVDIEFEVMGLVDQAHAAHAEHAQNAKAPGNDFADHQFPLRHHSGDGRRDVRVVPEIPRTGGHVRVSRRGASWLPDQCGAGPSSALAPSLPTRSKADTSARLASSSSADMTLPA